MFTFPRFRPIYHAISWVIESHCIKWNNRSKKNDYIRRQRRGKNDRKLPQNKHVWPSNVWYSSLDFISLFLFFFFFIIYVLFLLLHYTSSRAIKSFIKWQQSDKLLRNSGHINQNKATSLLQLFSNIRYYAKEGISKNKHKNETISLHNHSQGTCSDFTNAFN